MSEMRIKKEQRLFCDFCQKKTEHKIFQNDFNQECFSCEICRAESYNRLPDNIRGIRVGGLYEYNYVYGT